MWKGDTIVMSEKIDRRIVEMSFENDKFEKGIAQSKNSLKDFTKALENSGSKKSFSGLQNSVNDLSSSISAMEQIAIGALRRIGSEAITAGARIIKSIAIEPITQGFQELELKMDSTKTILASTGETLEVVNEKLNELNEYSDKTIYSFSDMTQNIGKFTNAGVKLDVAVSSIQGIANAAALAGANSNQASMAMYNFAQALSSGSVKLIDWKSIEVATMATVDFKQELMDSAVAAGTLAKTADGMYTVLTKGAGNKGMAEPISATKNFNESLQAQWMTTKVLTETLSRYSDATTDVGRRAIKAAMEVNTFSKLMDTLKESVGSGWAQTFELIFGDFEQSKKLWTGINDVLGAMIDKTSDVRNALLKGGLGEFVKGQMTGRENIIQGLKNAVVAFLEAIKPISEAWDQIFPPMAVERLYKITESFKNFTAQLRISEENANKLKRTFAGVFAAFDIIKEALRFVAKTALEVINIFIPLGDSILSVTANIGDFVVGLRNAIKNSQLFNYAILAVKIGVTLLKNVLLLAYDNIKKFVKGLLESKNPVEYLINLLGKFGEVLKSIGSWIVKTFSTIVQKIQDFIGLFKAKNYDGINTASNSLKTLGSTIGNVVTPAFQKLKEILSNITFEKIISFVVGAVLLNLVWQISRAAGGFANLTKSIGSFLSSLSKGLSKNTVLRDIAISIGVLTASIWVLSKIPADAIYSSLAKIAIGLGLLVGAFALLKVIDLIPGSAKGTKLSVNFASIAVGILAIIGVLKILSTFDSSVIAKALPNLAFITLIMAGIQALFSLAARIGGGNKLSTNMLSFTASMVGMIALVGILSIIPPATFDKGLFSLAKLGVVLAGIQMLFSLAARIGGGNVLKNNMLAITLSMAGMVGLVALLNSFTDEQFSRGFSNLTKIAGIIALFQVLSAVTAKISGGSKTSLLQMIGVVAIVIALAGSLVLLSLVDQTALANAADSFSKVIAASGILAVGLTVLSSFGAGIGPILLGVLALIAAIGIIVAAFVGIAWVMEKLDADMLTDGFNKLASVGNGIGKFLGSIVGGFAEGTLESTGRGLASFLKAMEGINPSSVDMISMLASAFFTMSFTRASSVKTFAKQLEFLITSISEIDSGSIETASNNLNAMVPMVEGIKAFSDVASTLPNSGASFVSFFVGDNKLDDFGTQLSGLIAAFNTVSITDAQNAASSITELVPVINALESFAKLGAKLPNSGLSVVSFFVGENNIDEFGAQIAGLISVFNTVTPTKSQNAVDSLQSLLPVIGMLESFAKFGAKLPNSGLSFVSFFVGDNKIDEFGVQIAGLVSAFGIINATDVDNAVTSIEKLGTMLETLTQLSEFNNGLKNSGGLQQLGTGNTTLNEFGKQVKGLVDNIAKIDIDGAKKSFEVLTELGKVLSDLASVEISLTENTTYMMSIDKFLNAIKNKILSFTKTFYNAGKELLTNIRLPFENEKQTAWEEIGSWIPKSIANGINKDSYLATDAGIKMAEELEESIRNATGIHSESEEYAGIGSWIPKSISSGIETAKNWALGAAEKLGIDTGSITTEGISESLSSGEGIVSQGIQALLDKLTGTSEDSGDVLGNGFVSGFQDAITNSISGLSGDTTVEKVKTELEKLQEYIEEEKYYSRMSLREELAEYIQIQAKYAAGSEERKKIDREVYRLQKEIYENQKSFIEENIKAKKEAAEKLLDLETTYNSDVAQVEKNREKEHTRIVKEAEEKRQELREDYAEKQKEIAVNLNAEIKRIREDYSDKLNSRTNSIMGSYGIFDEVGTSETISGDTLLKNLKGQVAAIADWNKSLTELASRGVGQSIINELQEMGPSSTQQIKGLLSLTDDQLTEYVKLYGDKYALARTRAESELSYLKTSIPNIIQELRFNARVELNSLEKAFDESMSDVNNQMYRDLLMMNLNADLSLEELKSTFDTNSNDIYTSLAENLTSMKTTFDNSMSEIDGLTVEELENLNSEFEQQIMSLNDELEINLGKTAGIFEETGAQINTNASIVLSTLKEIYSAGSQTVANLAQGILKNLPSAENAAKTLVDSLLEKLSEMIENFRLIGIESAAAYVAGFNESNNVSGVGWSNGVTNMDTSSQIANSLADLGNTIVAANSKTAANIYSGTSVQASSVPNQNESKASPIIEYTQNNYSPKALSQLDIYRNTKTQLATLKEAVSAS